MSTVFLSYSKKDYFFAELADIKLSEAGISLWRDQGQLRAGADWRQGIENAISDSLAVLVALSANSAESSYVKFEWAYALGKGKALIPLMLNECSIHPKLETIQHLDFSASTCRLSIACGISRHPPTILARMIAWLRTMRGRDRATQ